MLPDNAPAELGIFALYAPNRYLAAKTRVFIDFLVARFGEEPAWDAFRQQRGAGVYSSRRAQGSSTVSHRKYAQAATRTSCVHSGGGKPCHMAAMAAIDHAAVTASVPLRQRLTRIGCTQCMGTNVKHHAGDEVA